MFISVYCDLERMKKEITCTRRAAAKSSNTHFYINYLLSCYGIIVFLSTQEASIIKKLTLVPNITINVLISFNGQNCLQIITVLLATKYALQLKLQNQQKTSQT